MKVGGAEPSTGVAGREEFSASGEDGAGVDA